MDSSTILEPTSHSATHSSQKPFKTKIMKRIILLLLVSIWILPLQAQHLVKHGPKPRPKVGVVFGGGGAKGAAHIGVLKYLEEIGIPVDYVAGTSIGSIIGGLYAMGYSPDELASLIADMNWSEYVGNKIDRSAMSLETRERSSTFVVNIPFSLDRILHGKLKDEAIGFIPSAYVNNTALINLFNDLCVGYQKEMDFDDLPIPFACVATDIRTGKEIVIRHGSVPTAMRASMAIPGVFSPVAVGKHLLVDGGLVNNFPADIVKEMGANIIIGVEVSDADTLYEAEESITVADILNGLINNAVNTKRYENQTLCDVHITPDITGYGTLSFNHDAIDTLVRRGYREATKHSAELMRLKHQLDSINGAPLAKKLRATKARNLADAPVFISSIDIKPNDKLINKWLLRKGKLNEGQFVSEKEINNAVDIYRGTGAFDDITYNLTENGLDTINGEAHEAYTLTMNFKPTHPHVFSLGLRYDTEEGAGLLLKLGLNEKRLAGFKLNLCGKLSYNPKFNVTGTYSGINIANFSIAYDYRGEHYKSLVTDNNYSNLHYEQHKVSGYVSQFHLLDINTAVGASFTSTSFDQTSPTDFSNDTIDQSIVSWPYYQSNLLISPFVTFQYDNLDHPYFAKHGISTTLKGQAHFDLKEKNTTFEASYSIQGYITPKDGRFTIIPQLYARCLFNGPIYANLWNVIGGEIIGRHFDHQLPFIGVNHVDYVNDLTVILRCDLRYNFLEKHYVTATYNFLYGANPFGTGIIRGDKFYSGAGLRYSYNSFFGPISFTLQWSNCTKRVSTYISLGYTF